MRERREEKKGNYSKADSRRINTIGMLRAPSGGEEAMKVDSSQIQSDLSVKKKAIICFYCHKPGHIKPQCPKLKGKEKSL